MAKIDHCFAKVDQGKIVRLYCYSGEMGHVFKNIGEKTEAEQELTLNFAARDEDLFEVGVDDIDEDHILQLAEKWSSGPESLLGEGEQESMIAEIRK